MEEGAVKLASLFCVAALSVVGCGGVETTGGGQGEGIKPSKIEFVDPNAPKPFDPRTLSDFQIRISTAPADSVCEGCIMESYSVVDTSAGVDEVRVVSDGGMELCKIYLNQDQVIVDECGSTAP
jgi:hypothetical protein